MASFHIDATFVRVPVLIGLSRRQVKSYFHIVAQTPTSLPGRIRDNLANHYGEDAVFMDIDSIPLGFDYRKQMRDALSDNKVMIAVIGPKWLGGRGKDARINANNVDGVVITFVSTSESITLRTARLTVRPT